MSNTPQLIQQVTESAPGILSSVVTCTVNGSPIRGILTRPSGQPTHLLVFSHGWSGNKSGPGSLLKYLADTLAAKGCACLRFDFRGRGESGGDGLNASLATMSEDLQAAVKYAESLTGIHNPVIVGMCSGGNIAIGTLPNLPEVHALFLLSVYPFSDGDSFGRDVHRTWHFLRVYLHKACSLDSWRRLFKGEASLARVFRVLFRPFLKRGENRQKEEGQNARAPGKSAKASTHESRLQQQNGSEPPRKYLANLKPDIRATMLYGTADPDAAAALSYYGAYVNQHKLPIVFSSIEGANHNFSSAEWHENVASAAADFITNL